jgi:pimeloyl-ACP methyl ester carboxylesterase
MRILQRVILALALVLAGLAAWLWTPDRPRAALETEYAAPPSKFLSVAGLRLHVRESGPVDAPALLLLHGFGASLQTWDTWASQLPQYRVIRFDLPGFGLTGADPTGDYTDTRSMEVVIALMESLHLVRTTIAGHSLGGRIAWKFAALHPERVDKLVLIAPDGFASPGFEYGKAPAVPAVLQLMRYVLPRPLVKMNLSPGYANSDVMTEALVTRYYELMLAPGVRAAMLARLEQTVLEDPAPLLGRIHAPVLLLWGEQDRMIPFTNSADYVRALPQSTLVPLPGIGHLPQEEAPDVALEPLKAFLAQ